MDSNSKTGNANGPHKLSLKLRERQKSLERQSTARGFSVTEHREASTTTTKPTVLDTSTLDDHLKEVLKRLVHRLIDSENAFYALGDRIKKRETSVLDETCPKGLTIKPVNATGKRSQLLQREFDAILNDAQTRIIEVTIKDLRDQETEASKLCGENRDKIEHSLAEWRKKFRCADETFLPDADKHLDKARKFVEDFYFQCASIRASKELQESLKREEKAKRAVMQMEQDFVASEQTITEIVRHELASTKSQPKQTKSKKPKAAKTAVSPAPGKQGRTKSKERRNSAGPPKRSKSRSQSRGRSTAGKDTRNSVSFKTTSRQTPKNGKHRGSGPVR